VAVPDAGAGWSRSGHRRAVLAGGLILCLVVGGSIATWAQVSGGSTDYRMATVTRADIGTTLTVVGSVAPVSDATASFQVGGKVASVTVSPGQLVTAGETLGTLDTTALSESVSSAQSTLQADEAKLAEDESSQSSGTSSSGNSPSGNSSSGIPSSGSRSPASSSTTTTTVPSRDGSASSGQNDAISQDQATLTQDQSTLSLAQQQEAADIAQAQNDCRSASTGTPTGQATCEAALQTVSIDEQQVSRDQARVSHDETVLAQALAAAAGGLGSTNPAGAGNTGSSPAQSANKLASYDSTGNTGAGGTGDTGNTGADNSTRPNNGTSSAGTSTGSSSSTDTPTQIASDQAAIDTAEADLTEAQQALEEATLTSPINGTVVSVGITTGDTVSAGSATEIITIIGTKAYEVQGTLTSSQVPSVKTGQSASVEVDGVDGSLHGTVSQVGPVQSTSNGYSYPVIIALPSSGRGFYAGSSANVVISTGEVSRVVAVPTSSVQSLGSRSYVLELSKGELTRKFIKIGMVGDTYTQVVSGLAPGQSVVLVDYAEPVPSSNTNSLGGLGGFLGGGGGNDFFGGPGAFFSGRGGGGGGLKGIGG
jgi:multidrug efflux pump subunit AcrA (membrane-fusion protein)